MKGVPVAFAALSAVFMSSTAAWLVLDRSAPTWDDAIYLKNSLTLYDTLRERGVGEYARSFLKVMDSKPPLIAALPTPAYFVAGRHPRAAYFVNLLFMLVMFGAIFRIGVQFGNARAGLLALYLAGTMPMLYGLSHWYLTDFILTALVTAAIAILCASGKLIPARHAALLGVLFGLGVMLKLTFPLYFAIPALYYAVRVWREGRLKALLAFVIPAALIALPWYALHFRAALQTGIDTGSEAPLFFGSMSPYSPTVMGPYLVKLAHGGPGLDFAALAVLLLLGWKGLTPSARSGLKWCLLWAAPLAFVILWPAREVRYAAPVFPAVAVALAILTESIWNRSRKAARGAIAFVLAIPFVSMVHSSFGFPRYLPLSGLLGPVDLTYAREFNPRPWPHQQVLEALCEASACSPSNPQTVLIGTDGPRFNADTFALYAVKRRLPLKMLTTAYETQWSAVAPLLDSASFFVAEDRGEPRSVFFNVHGGAALKHIVQSGEFLEWRESFPSPDGGTAHVYQRALPNGFLRGGRAATDRVPGLHDTSVTMGDVAELTGFAIEQRPGTVTVRFRWKYLRAFDRPYWAFVHVVDSKRRVVGYLDHPLIRKDLQQSRPGDVAIETRELQSEAVREEPRYGLEVGLYLVASGERIPVVRSDFPLVDDRTAAAIGVPPPHSIAVAPPSGPTETRQ